MVLDVLVVATVPIIFFSIRRSWRATSEPFFCFCWKHPPVSFSHLVHFAAMEVVWSCAFAPPEYVSTIEYTPPSPLGVCRLLWHSIRSARCCCCLLAADLLLGVAQG